MAAISQTINNVLGGISQQPDPVKLPGQVRDAVNVYLDPTFGASKRQGTKFIAELGTDIPDDAKWFPVFRDNNERYVVCIYRKDDASIVRVFAADSGNERQVTIKGSAEQYLEYKDSSSISALTINDYTFLCNSEKTVTMNTDRSTSSAQRALVTITQVAYNTNYSVLFLRDGDEVTQKKVYRASKLSVSPASFEVSDAGDCALQSTKSYVLDGEVGKDLGFDLRVNCSPKLITGEEPGLYYPTRVTEKFGRAPGYEDSYGVEVWVESIFGASNDRARGSYLYKVLSHKFPNVGEITVRVEVRVNFNPPTGNNYYEITSVDILGYTNDGPNKWTTGLYFVDARYSSVSNREGAIDIWVESVRQGESTPTYTYSSEYDVQVVLNSGGTDWEVGDTVTVTQEGKSYTVKVEETAFSYAYQSEADVSYTTPKNATSNPLNVNDIVANLVDDINALDNYSAEPVGNTIVITRTDDDRDFNIQTRGGAGNQALYGIKDTVNDISQLPAQCVDGFTLKVSNSGETDADDYYVSFKTEGGIPGQGAWEETLAPNIETSLNEGTMPHALVRLADGNFEVRPLSKEYEAEGENNHWVSRAAGDLTTNPNPSFVGNTIKEVFFYQNRLGFISNSTVILSQAGDYFNFFTGSAIALSDADPVDMATSATRPATLKAALTTPNGLLLFAENSQFLLKSDDAAFGPATAQLDEISNYAYKSKVPPVETGVSVLFHTEAATYSKVFEMSIESLKDRPLASENTRIVPELIPPKLTTITAVPNQSLVLFGNDTEDVYVFKFYNTGNERQLAGWTKWEFAAPIKMIEFDHDTGYFISRNGESSLLLRMELLDDPATSQIEANGSKFQPRLDHFITGTDSIKEDLDDDKTRLLLPDGFMVPGKPVFLVSTYAAAQTFYVTGDVQQDADTGQYYFDINNDISSSEFVIGIGYSMTVELPNFYLKEGDDNRADRRNYPMVENAYIDLYFSGRYDCTVKRLGYDDVQIPLEIVKADIYEADSASIAPDLTQNIPVFAPGNTSTLTLTADGPLPASLTSYHWEGHYSTRGIKRR